MRFSTLSLGALLLSVAMPAMAQDAGKPDGADVAEPPAPPIALSGSVNLVTDYRFRGLTQSDEDVAIQGTVNVNHESGFYVGTFLSSIDGGGDTPLLAGYGDVEIDLYGGFAKTLPNGLGIDVGLLYYYYADSNGGLNTDFFEPYASLTYTLGPVATKLGVAYAYGGQDGLNGFDPKGGNDDNIYIYFDPSTGIPGTPITLKAHIGYSEGALGAANGTTDNNYFDWSLGAEVAQGPFKVGVSYVDTDVPNDFVPGIGQFDQELGRGSTVLGYVGFSF